MKNYLSIKFTIHIAVISLCIVSMNAFGQNCNALNVSLGQDILACNGTNITLTANISGGPTGLTPIYTWQFNPFGSGVTNTIPGATGSSYTITNFSNSLDGTYTVTVNYTSSSCTDFDNILVNQPNGGMGLFDVDAGIDINICQGSNANINTSLSNTPNGANVTYSWNSVPNLTGTYPNQANPTFSNLPIGTYNFAVTATATSNGNTSIGCDIVQVNVNTLNLNAGNDQTICQGSPFNISSTISNQPSSPAVTYSWTAVNTTTGSPITLTQTGSSSNPTFNNLPVGTYTFTGTATVNGCTDTDQIQVTVNANPAVPTFTIPASGCPGISIPVTGFSPVSGINYTWNAIPNSMANVSGGGTSSPTIVFNSGGNYSVSVSATNLTTGCSSTSISDLIAVTTVDVFTPDVANVATGVYLNGSLYEGVYTFDVCNTSGTVQFLIENLTSNNNSSNNSNTIYTFSWGAGTPVNNFTSTTQSPVLGNNPFTITASYLGCTVSETFNIYIGSNPSVSVGVGNTLDLCPGGSTSAAQITPGALSPGTTYNLYFSDHPGVVVQSFTDITAVTTANPYIFTTGSCGYNVQGNTCIPNNQNVFYAYVVATNACSESCANSTAITVDTPPTAAFTINPTTACTNTNVTVTSNATSGTDISGSASQGFTCSTQAKIKWSISPSTGFTVVNGNLGGTSGNWANWNGSNTLTLNFTTAGTYNITQNVQSNETCGTSTISHTICVVAPPVCAFTPSPLSGCTVLPVSITNNTTGPSCGTTPLALSYNWTVTNPTGGTSAVTTASSVSPSIALTNNTTGILTFPINVLVNPLIPGTTTPVANCSSTCTQSVVVYPQPTFTTQPQSPPNVCGGGTFNAISVVVNFLGVTGPGVPTYQWYSNTTASSTGGTLITGATSASYVPPATAVGTIYYYCVVTFPNNTNCNQIISNNVPAVVAPDPIATATPATQTICVGGTVPNPLTGAYTNGVGTPSYQWNLVGTPTTAIVGATTSTYTPLAFGSTGTFNYTVTINTSGSGCTASTSAQISVVVVPDPTITVPIATQTLCQNATPTALTVTASGGSGTLQYQWYSNTVNNTTNGTLITGATSNTYTPPTSAVGTLYYYCVVTTPVSGCSVTSATSTVIVIPAPTFTTQPTASNVCVGGTPTQMCVTFINGTGTPSYQWYSNSANSTAGATAITGATTNCYTPPATTAGTTYYYAVISLTGGGCSVITSNIAAVVITPDPALTTQPTSTQTICVGGSSSALTVALQASTGIGAFTYQWYSNTTASNSGGTSIVGANAATYNPPVFNTAGSFYYYCVVTDAGNGCGTVTSQVATIIVVVDPTISAQPITTQTLCQTAAPTPLTITASGGTGTLLYQWYSNAMNNNTSGTIISGATASNYSPPTATIGTIYYYCVVITAASGCSVTSTTSTVSVYLAPSFTTQPSTSNVCVGGTTNPMCVTYSNGTGTAIYEWYSNSTNNTVGGTLINGANSICYTPPSTSVGTTYYYAIVSLTGGGCSSITSNTAAVIIVPDPVITAQPINAQTICVGGTIPAAFSVTYSGGFGIPAYQWYSTPAVAISGATNSTYTPPTSAVSGTFNYYATISLSGSGCDALTSSNASVIVIPDPIISTQPILTQTLCQNSTPTALSIAASGGTGTYSYQWYSNTVNNVTSGTVIPGATASTYSPPTATIGTRYYYCVVTTTASGCSVTSTTSALIVTTGPTFTIQPTPTSNVCVGGTTNQMCVAYSNGPGTASYQWYSNSINTNAGGTIISGATNSCYLPSSTSAGTTYYYANITFTGGGCTNITSSTAAVVITPDPVIATQPIISETICTGGSANSISVVSSGGIGGFTYQWYSNTTNSNFGGAIIPGATGSSYTPGSFSNPTTNYYYVTIGNNGNGCGSLNSNTSTLNVIQDPTVSVTPSFQNICTNGTISPISVSYSGGIGTATYQWYISTNGLNTAGTPISGATSSSYSPPTNSVSNLFYYASVNQSTSGCAANSNVSQLQISLSPTFSSQPTLSQSLCLGGTPNTLAIGLANAIGVPTYQWWSNNVNSTTNATAILGANSSTYTPLATNIGTTYYFCSVSFTASNCGYITSNISSVNVVADPIISTQPAALQTLCVGGTANILSVIATGGTGSFSYQWFNASTNSAIFGTNSMNFAPGTFNSASNNSYYVQVSQSGSGCNSLTSNTVQVNVVSDPLATITSGASYCQNYDGVNPLSVIVVSGGEGTASYQWYSSLTSGNTSGNPISGATEISYTPSVNVIGNTYYYCVITQTGVNCSVNTAASQIIVISSPTITTQPVSSQSRCVGASMIQLSVGYNNGTGIPTYQWHSNSSNTYTGGTAIPLANEAFYTPPNSTPGTLYYYCELTFQTGGCSAIYSNIASVILFPDPTISIQPLLSQTICAGGQGQIQPLSVTCINQPGGVTYQWYREPNLQIANGIGAQYTPTQNSTGTFNYYVVISSSVAGCDMLTSNMSVLIIAPDPIISEELNFVQALCPFADNINSPTVIVDYSNEIAPPTYIWYEVNQGNTTPLANSNQNAYFPQPPLNGSFNSQCVIQFDYPGCEILTSALSVLTFEDTNLDCYPQLNIADAFSPNNDGINDYWTITGLDKFNGFEINIFNSFGQNIYQLKNVLPNWDGTWNGETLPNGDYFYSIKLIELNRTIFGTISIAK